MINYSHSEVEKDFINAENFLKQDKNVFLSSLIDSTILKPQSMSESIAKLCKEAIEFKFRAVCIPPCFVSFASQFLKDNNIKICTVSGFPNGYNAIETKCFEAKQALNCGAHEIDFVHNISFVKDKNWIALEREYENFVEVVENKVCKLILETSLLTEEEIYKCTHLAATCGFHIVKTSTGFGERGASLNDIVIIKKALDEYFAKTNIRLGIKASGGIRNREDAMAFVKAGATRLGTSNGKKIIFGETVNSY